MHRPRPHARGRLVAAIVISLALHALVGVAWLFGPTHGTAGGSSIDDVVNGPDPEGTTIVLRERAPEPIRVEAKPSPEPVPVKPVPLPPAVVEPIISDVGAVRLVGTSPAAPSHLPNSVGSGATGGKNALHGKKTGRTIVYVLDRSASMGPDGLLRRAVEAVLASLDQLGPDTRFQIVAYNGGTSMLAREPVAPSPAARDRAADWLRGLPAEGRSDHRAAFREALSMRPDEVYLLTDADDLEESDVRSVAGLLRTPVRISAAVFGGNRPAAGTPLERLAERTGGEVRYVGP